MRYREINEANLKLIKGDLPRIRGSYGAFIITMEPLDFLKLTAPEADFERIKARPFPHDREKWTEINDGKDRDYGRFNIPFLTIEWPSGKVVGHEGRHRAWMVHQQGGTNFPVAIYMRHPNEYEVVYDEYNVETEESVEKREDFGTNYAAAKAREDELKNHSQKERDAWQHAYDNDLDFDISPISYHGVKIETYRPGDIKGSPNHVNPNDPWERKPYAVEDMPQQLLGQYDDSVVVTKYKVGLVKGYSHFR